MGREHYREFHEFEFSPQMESRSEHGEVADDEDEVVEDDCPDCKHDSYCKGGCESGTNPNPEFKFERKEVET